MNRGLGRGAEGHDAAHEVRILGRPLVGLASGHRPAGNQGDALDIKRFSQKPVLARDIVVEGDLGKVGTGNGRVGVAGRGRKAIAEHIDGNDEMPFRIDRPARAEKALVALCACRYRKVGSTTTFDRSAFSRP